jgi:thioredoxin reductase (NADPH)
MSEKIMYINAPEFEKEVLQGDKVIVDFYSTECPPCEALAHKYEELAELFGDKIKFIKILRQDNRELAVSLGVTSSPTVLFYDKGKLVGDILRGGIKRSELIKNISLLIGEEEVKTTLNKIQKRTTECDVLILGGGPGGLTAAIYSAQAKLKTIVVDKELTGGQVKTTHMVWNYSGFPEPIPGYMLMHYMFEQSEKAGAEFRQAVDVSSVDLINKVVVVDDVETIKAKKIIISTGSSPRVIGVKGEKEYKGQGISYCATCDAKFYEGKKVVVIGGGNSAIEESLFIAKFADEITIVHQFDKLQANKMAQEKAFANPKIKFMFEHEPREFIKEGQSVNKVVVEDLKTKELKTIETDGVFIFAGMVPNLELFKDKFELDNWGYIKTDNFQRTSIKDVFAVGDVASKPYRQITVAVAEGTVAAIQAAKEIEEETTLEDNVENKISA